MPNRRVHVEWGCIAGAVTSAVTMRQGQTTLESLAEIVGGIVGGFLGARLPDLLEPATSPNHRAFCHSWAASIGAGVFLPQTLRDLRDAVSEAEWAQKPGGRILAAALRGAIAGSAGGYASHLVLDALTPRGLPIA